MKPDNPKVSGIAAWFGSNRMLAPHVGQELAGCEWVGVAFAGSVCEVAHIDARTLNVNDLHSHLINLARVTQDPVKGAKLYRHLRRVPFHPVMLMAAQSRCREREQNRGDLFGEEQPEPRTCAVPDLEWAIDYFVCAWMSRHGTAGTSAEFSGGTSVRWNSDGGDSAAHFQGAVRAIPAWRRLLRRANFTCMDAFDFIAKVKDADGHGLYCDPPFPGPGDAYKHTFGEAGQVKLAQAVARFTRTRVVMRFYDHPLIRRLYPEPQWTWRRLVGRKSTNARAPEVLLINGTSLARGEAA